VVHWNFCTKTSEIVEGRVFFSEVVSCFVGCGVFLGGCFVFYGVCGSLEFLHENERDSGKEGVFLGGFSWRFFGCWSVDFPAPSVFSIQWER
jgi:hypothetical protein